jgi:uncharacterized protein YabE (DUF348 family)/3D (Asp-Asp-Asp) domain-containing protein
MNSVAKRGDRVQLYIRRHVYAVISVTALTFAFAILYSLLTFKTISLNVDGTKTVIRGLQRGTVNDLLHRLGISVKNGDIITPPLQTALQNEMNIVVDHQKKVTLIDGGNSPVAVVSYTNTVDELLQEKHIVVTKSDELNIPRNAKLVSGERLIITRHAVDVIVTKETIPFQTQRQPDPNMFQGQVKVLAPGVDGVAQVTTTIVYLNGKPIHTFVQRQVIQQPQDRKVAYGTQSYDSLGLAYRGDAVYAGGGTPMSMIATAYTSYGTRTATGMTPTYGVVAVDPSVIPLGTRLYVTGYGYARAEDTGGAIKGYRIDVYFPTEQQAENWGRRRVTVYILDGG